MFNKLLGKTLHRGDRDVLTHDFKPSISSNKVIDAGTPLQEKNNPSGGFQRDVSYQASFLRLSGTGEHRAGNQGA